MKNIASFDFFDKSILINPLIVLSATSGSISITSFAKVIGTPVAIAFSLSAGLVKKLLKTT